MPHKGKRSSKSSRSHRGSRRVDETGELPRDPDSDWQQFQHLYNLVVQRVQLQGQFQELVAQLAARRAGIQTAEELYAIFINMDFRLIHGLSSSANAARGRRGVLHEATKNHQTEEIDDPIMANYRELGSAFSFHQHVQAIPQSLGEFAAEEQAIIRSLANIQDTLAELFRDILNLQTWLQFMLGEDPMPKDFVFFRGNGGDDDGHDDGDGPGGSTLDSGEHVVYY
ncbi:hypothetical protein N0V84_005042 [Fusarium piperis]|uniref:Uncharacterized protein n=1 Tax=Fusarium piperis TaxID=1435070 RepID=A0A9W9BPC2_9HYPO|nr:hypothetical protein N0V84_005042 [Fusarium piperis]